MEINVILNVCMRRIIIFFNGFKTAFAVLTGSKLLLLFHLLFISYLFQDVAGIFVLFV